MILISTLIIVDNKPNTIELYEITVTELHLNQTTKEITFDEKDIRKASNVTAEQLQFALKGTALEECVGAYIASEKEVGINALFMVALTANESAWGLSKIAQDKNNLTGLRAYNKDPYTYSKAFETPSDSIKYTANHIANKYLVENGPYHNGYGIKDINIRYAVNDDGSVNENWSKTIIRIINELQHTIKESGL